MDKMLNTELNNDMQRIDKQDKAANNILLNLKPGDDIPLKDIKKVFGPKWKEKLLTMSIPGANKRDRKKTKQAKQARKANRRKK